MSTIIHIITTLERGGAEKHLLDLSAAQTRSHKQVKVIPLKGLNTLEHEFIKNGIEVLNFLLNRPFVVQIFLLYKYNETYKCLFISSNSVSQCGNPVINACCVLILSC